MCGARRTAEPRDVRCSAERTRTRVRSIGRTRMQLSNTRWVAALAAVASLACLTSAAGASPRRGAHPLAVTAARNATAAHPVRPAIVHRRGHHARPLRSTTLTMRRAVGSTRPLRLPVAPKSHRAAAIPTTIAHRAPTSRTARGNAPSAWLLPGQGAVLCLAVRDLRASECLVPMIANDPVWSGRGPPRAGPHSDQPRPQRPAPTGSFADAPPSASALRATNPRLTISTAVHAAASGCRFACRPEGTAASLIMPSSGVEHVS